MVLLIRFLFLGPLDYLRNERLDSLVGHEDDSLPGDNSSQPGHDPLVEALYALVLDNLFKCRCRMVVSGEGGGGG